MVMGSLQQETEVAVIGAGPGGYVAALRAADLGQEVVLIEARPRLGGTCLLEGCIPSKTLIHAVDVVETARQAQAIGLRFGDVQIDLPTLRQSTKKVVDGLARGVRALLDRRGVEVIHARARFRSDQVLALEGADVAAVEFRHAIIATGSRINELPPGFPDGVWSSAEALQLPEIPARLLVVGGGYIGLELGLVYAGLGSEVTVVEFAPRLLLGADADLVDVVVKHCKSRLAAILVDSKVIGVEKVRDEFVAGIEHQGQTQKRAFDRVLVATGRRPNTDELGLDELGIEPAPKSPIQVDAQGRTKIEHIYAIGDVTPGPMLAHKAAREAKVVAEVIAGQPAALDNRAIPAVVFTDPEIAWTGITEREAKDEGIELAVGRFPLAALGRARTLGRTEGLVKVLSEPASGLIRGVAMVGPYASELIAEGTLAIEMGATLEDLIVTIHPHPTMSESIMEAAEVAAGHAVHIFPASASLKK